MCPSYLKYSMLAQSVSAMCQENVSSCTAPSFPEALVMVQQRAVNVYAKESKEEQSKVKKVKGNYKCVVWHSQHKSAGRVGELMLGRFVLSGTDLEYGARWDMFRCDAWTWDCEKTMCVNDNPLESPYRVAYQGYTNTLVGSRDWGSPGDGQCVWATMSREPVSRLISAYFYCQYGDGLGPKDPLCGRSEVSAQDATVQEWAKHWGNFLFRELLLSTNVRQFAEMQPDFRPENKCTNEPWLSWKHQLNGGDDPRTVSGKSNLMELKKHMTGLASPLYDVHGVVERWEETMALFDDVIPLDQGHVSGKRGSWLSNASSIDDDHGSKRWKAKEVEALKLAQKDPVVLAELAADIDIYNHVIVPEFNKRVKSMGNIRKD